VQKLPVLYIYTRHELDLALFRSTLCDQFPPTTDLLVLYDVQFDNCLRTFQLADRPGRCFVGIPDNSDNATSSEITNDQGVNTCLHKFGRRFPVSSWDDLNQCTVVFVISKTEDNMSGEARLLSLLFTFSQQQRDLFVYEVSAAGGSGSLVPVSRSVERLLRRRYYLVEKARDAERVGILVGTLGSRDYPLILERLRQTVRRAGKRCYTFLLGKPNVAKLANFPEIDVFVLVACPESSFPDTKVSIGSRIHVRVRCVMLIVRYGMVRKVPLKCSNVHIFN
jgi:diphthamide biosynthesis protein 2